MKQHNNVSQAIDKIIAQEKLTKRLLAKSPDVTKMYPIEIPELRMTIYLTYQPSDVERQRIIDKHTRPAGRSILTTTDYYKPLSLPL